MKWNRKYNWTLILTWLVIFGISFMLARFWIISLM